LICNTILAHIVGNYPVVRSSADYHYHFPKKQRQKFLFMPELQKSLSGWIEDQLFFPYPIVPNR
jgi:hypothetical protein